MHDNITNNDTDTATTTTAKVVPCKSSGPVGGEGQLALASLLQAVKEKAISLRQAVRRDLER